MLEVTNMKEFLGEIDDLMKVPFDTVVAMHKAAGRDAINGVVNRSKTSVDRGELTGEWNTTIGTPSEARTGRLDQVGTETKNKNISVMESIKEPTVTYTQNSARHAHVLEFGLFVPPDPGPSKQKRPGREGVVLVSGGFAVRSPQGMLGVTFDSVKAKYERIAVKA